MNFWINAVNRRVRFLSSLNSIDSRFNLISIKERISIPAWNLPARFELLCRFLARLSGSIVDSSPRSGTSATRAHRCVRCRWARARPRRPTGAAAFWRLRPRRTTTWTPCSGTCSPSRRTARSRYSRCRATTR